MDNHLEYKNFIVLPESIIPITENVERKIQTKAQEFMKKYGLEECTATISVKGTYHITFEEILDDEEEIQRC